MNLIIPSSQVFIDGYSQRNFTSENPQFQNSPQEIILTRILNNMLKPFGDDCIIRGLRATISNDDKSVIFLVSPGLAIADSTLIEINETTRIDINVIDNEYSDTGYIVCYLNYRYPTTLSTIRATLRLRYVNSSWNVVLPDDWNPDEARIIIGIAKFTISNNKVTDAWSVTNSENFRNITIKGKSFNVQNMNRFISKMFENPYEKIQSIKVTQTHVNNGYITLNYWPRVFEVVDAHIIGGIGLINYNAILSAGLFPEYNFRGSWTVNEPKYFYHDVVDYNGKKYHCISTHLNDGKYEPGVVGGDWIQKWEIYNPLLGDFAIFENKFIIRNGTYNSVIGDIPFVVDRLSEEIDVGDFLTIEYIY